MSDMEVRVWRVYNNGHIKNESHVLWPHFADGQRCTGYNGDVEAWSNHNKEWRSGCAQIVQEGEALPRAIYNGYLSDERLASIIKAGLPGEITSTIRAATPGQIAALARGE